MARRWETEDDAKLTALWASDTWLGVIIRDLGRSHNSVCGRAKRLSLPARGMTQKPTPIGWGGPRVLRLRIPFHPCERGHVRKPYRPGIDPRPQAFAR